MLRISTIRYYLVSAFVSAVIAPLYYAIIQMASKRSPRPNGTMRGANFYSAMELFSVVVTALRQFYGGNGYFPNVIAPKTFNDRMFYRKFLEDLSLPVLADKLLLKELVKTNVGERFVADVVAATADSDELVSMLQRIPCGTYFLKSNNGSGTNYKFTIPESGLAESDIEKIADFGTRFLKQEFGYGWGEWYYHTFRPVLFIEEALSVDDPYDWRFFVVYGEVKLIRVTKNYYTHSDAFGNTYTPDWQPLNVKTRHPLGPPMQKPDNFSEMLDLALKVASLAKTSFVRVDLYCIERQLFVGEVTYIPGNGISEYYNQPCFSNMWE